MESVAGKKAFEILTVGLNSNIGFFFALRFLLKVVCALIVHSDQWFSIHTSACDSKVSVFNYNVWERNSLWIWKFVITVTANRNIIWENTTLKGYRDKPDCQNWALPLMGIWVFFHKHSRITELQGKGKGISLTHQYHFHPLHRHLDISRAITAESSPLHIASSRTRTENLWFPSASH